MLIEIGILGAALFFLAVALAFAFLDPPLADGDFMTDPDPFARPRDAGAAPKPPSPPPPTAN